MKKPSRDIWYKCRVTRSEFELIRDAAKALGMTQANLLLAAIKAYQRL